MGQDGFSICFKRSYLTIQAQIRMTFVLYNITHVSHISFATQNTVQRIWYIMKEKKVDIEMVILNKIWEIVDLTKRRIIAIFGLIMGLCRHFGVDISDNHHV